MPSRVIRDGWLESESVNQLKPEEERFFLRLCLRADDHGRYHANPVLLRSTLFPLREDVRSTDIPRWLAACEKSGLVRCYEVSGTRYVEIVKFRQRMRAPVSKFPDAPTNGGHPPTHDGGPPPEAEANLDLESDLETKKDSNPPQAASTASPPKVPIAQIVADYHDTCKSLPRVTVVTDSRTKAIKARWREAGEKLDWFRELFRKAEASDFVSGRSGKWTNANFDWLMNPSNSLKVIEGNYDNRRLVNTDKTRAAFA